MDVVTINADYAAQIKARDAALRAWMGDRTSYHPDELPTGIDPPTNAERSMLEVFEFCREKPDKYLLYVDEKTGAATTWTGERLGEVIFGYMWRGNFGDKRQSVQVEAVNGCTYAGTYYKSAGDYARVRKVKS